MLKIGFGKIDNPKFRHSLMLQRSKIVDENGKLIAMFPSRIDLDWRKTCREILVFQKD